MAVAGVVGGSSKPPPGIVPLRGLCRFQSYWVWISVVGEISESESLGSEEREVLGSVLRSIMDANGDGGGLGDAMAIRGDGAAEVG